MTDDFLEQQWVLIYLEVITGSITCQRLTGSIFCHDWRKKTKMSLPRQSPHVSVEETIHWRELGGVIQWAAAVTQSGLCRRRRNLLLPLWSVKYNYRGRMNDDDKRNVVSLMFVLVVFEADWIVTKTLKWKNLSPSIQHLKLWISQSNSWRNESWTDSWWW